MNEVQRRNAAQPKPVQVRRPAARPAPARPKDAPDAELLTYWSRRAKELPPVRAELIERVKAEIAAGTCATPEKIEAAVARLLEDLGM